MQFYFIMFFLHLCTNNSHSPSSDYIQLYKIILSATSASFFFSFFEPASCEVVTSLIICYHYQSTAVTRLRQKMGNNHSTIGSEHSTEVQYEET